MRGRRGITSVTVTLLLVVLVAISFVSFITYSYVSVSSSDADSLNATQNAQSSNNPGNSGGNNGNGGGNGGGSNNSQPRVTGGGNGGGNNGNGGGGSGSGGGDDNGGTASNQDPIAVLDATPSSGSVPLTVFFNANRSTDPENLPLSYNWTWFNGTAQLNDTNQSFGYTFRHAGEFAANLTVTDAGGAQSRTSIYIVVNSVCSNGVQELLEQCDGSDLDGLSCTTYPNGGFTGGSLSCTSACTFNTTSCTTTLPDTTPPQFSSISNTPLTYSFGQATTLSINVADNVNVASVNLTFNGQTYTNPSRTGNTYTQTVGTLGAGTYSYQWFASDTNGNINSTQVLNYVLARAAPSLTSTSSAGTNYIYGQLTTLSGTGCPTQGAGGVQCLSYLNNVQISNPSIRTLGVGTHSFVYNSTTGQNYSSSTIFRSLVVTQNTTSCTIGASSTSVTYPSTVTLTGNCSNPESQTRLYRNGVDVTASLGQAVQLAAGTYSFVVNVSSSQNYTNANSSTLIVTVAKATPSLTATSSAGSSYTYGSSNTLSGTGCPTSGAGDVQCRLYLAQTLISNGASSVLGAASYSLTFNSTSGQNYTAGSNTISFTVNRASSSCSVNVNPSTVTYPNTITASATCSSPEATARVYRNNLDVTASLGQAVQLGAGSYTYLSNTTTTQNYTGAQSSPLSVTVNPAAPSLLLQLTPSTSITQGTQSTATGTGCPAGLTCILRRGASTVSNPDTQTLAVGSYVYNYSTVGNANYSSASIIQTLSVNALPTFNLAITKTNIGSGTVNSLPAGIDCGSTCSFAFNQGQSVSLSALASTGSVFNGWSGSGCTGTGSCSVTMNSAQSVSANFGLQQFSLSLTKSGTGSGTVTSNPSGINCGATCSASYNYSTDVVLTATPTAGSTFAGWSGACSGTGTCTVDMTQARAVTATFTLQTFALSVTNSNPSLGAVTGPSINCGATCSSSYDFGTVVALVATPNAGALFTGWSGACSGTGSCSVTMDQARSVTANFAPQTFTLSVTNLNATYGSVTGTGINCGATCSNSYSSGTIVALTATPITGATFIGWTGGCTGTGSCSVTMDQARSVTANFRLQQFSLSLTKAGAGSGTVTSNPSGINCGATCSSSHEYNTLVTLSASPSAGSTFASWSGACTGSGSCAVTMTQARSVTATFNLQQFTLSVTKSGTGTGTVTSNVGNINCGSVCSNTTLLSGQVVLLTATPQAGSSFTGWSGACSGTGSCSVTMNSIQSVSAAFSLIADTTSPIVTIDSPLNQTYTSSTLSYSVQLNEAGFVNYSLDNGPNITMTDAGGNTFTATSGILSAGSHLFRVFAIDSNGNRNSTTLVRFSVNTATLPTGLCVVSDTSFQNFALPSQTSSFTFIVNATPTSAASDSLLMLADHDVAAFTDAAVIVRFNNANTIDARNGGAYTATNTIGYTPGTSYIFRLVVNPVAKTYSVFVTPQGGSEQTLATNFAFRTEQASVSTITRFALSSTSGGANVCDPRVNGNALNTCGNTQIEFGEVCDTSSQACTLGGYSGTASCNAQCTGINTCNIGSQACGDGIINGAESCDGAQLGGQSCTGLGFTSGTLSCSGSCTFNTASCVGAPSQACKNTLDDDSDGLVDMDDPGCADPTDTSEANTGAVYYVCNTGGSDSNAGTNKNAPWATFNKAKSEFNSLAAGDAILFCKGGDFAANSEAGGAFENTNCRGNNPCLLGSYTPTSGATAKPLIRATYSGSGGAAEGVIAWDIYGSSQILQGYTIRNIHFRNDAGSSNAVAILGGHGTSTGTVMNVTIDNIIADGFTSHGVVAQQGVYSLTLKNSLIQDSVGGANPQGFYGGGNHFIIDNNTFLNNGDRAIYDHNIYLGGTDFLGGEVYHNVSITRNYLRGTNLLALGHCDSTELVVHGHFTDVLIEGNTINNTGLTTLANCYGIGVSAGNVADETFDRTVIRNNIIIKPGAVGIDINACPDCIVENNVIVNENSGSLSDPTGINIRSGGVGNQNVIVRHNSIVLDVSNPWSDPNQGISITSSSGTANQVYGNSIYYKGSVGFRCFNSALASSAYSTFNYNNCYAPNLGSVTWMNSQSLSAWQSASGKDANSFVGNPLFSSITSPNYNLLPQSGSPLIDKVPLALAPLKDIRGGERPAGALADIGAYEFGAQLSPPTLLANGEEEQGSPEGETLFDTLVNFLSNLFSGTLFLPTDNAITGNVINDQMPTNSTDDERIYF